MKLDRLALSIGDGMPDGTFFKSYLLIIAGSSDTNARFFDRILASYGPS